MAKTWSTEQAGEVTCRLCGSVYGVTTHHFPTRDKDSFSCLVCGTLLQEWNDTACPSFELKRRGNSPKKRQL
jgi:hypothetical protein